MKNDRKVTELNFVQAAFFGLLAIVLLGAADPARAALNLIQNGGFETPVITGGSTIYSSGSSALSPWVISNEMSIKHSGTAWQSAEGSQSIALKTNNNNGRISQVIPTTAGKSYRLSFKYSRDPALYSSTPGKVTVRWGASNSGPFTLEEVFSFADKTTATDMKWRPIERTVQATSSSMYLAFSSVDNDSDGIALDDVSVTDLSPPLATPNLLGVIATGNAGATAYVVGRVDNITTETTLTVEALTCGSNSALIGSYTTITDKYGFFIFQTTPSSNLGLGTRLQVRVTAPQTTDASNCVTDTADNDYWPKALSLDGRLSAQDYIDVPGRGRWYKFTVAPSQSVRIKLSGLPADYDLVVFKDIGKAFKSQLVPSDTTGLLKVSAEFAPSVAQSIFSQSIFSQSIFSQSIFSQSIFSQSIFSQSIFSQSIFSQSIFSQSIFSQSIFSQSIFSQSIFSQSIFSQSIFSQSIFSPTCDPTSGYCYFKGLDTSGATPVTVDQIAQAYSAAQVQSLVGVSATPGTADELVVLNTWNNTGEYYIRVSGSNGASDPARPFTITVTPDTANVCHGVNPLPSATRNAVTGATTVFVTDTSLLDLNATVPGTNPTTTELLSGKLSRIMGRSEVNGVLVDLNTDQRVKDLKAQAAAHPLCPYAQNLVAQEIKSVIDTYRPGGLKYVVLLGNDATVPFFRYPDRSLLGEEFNYVPPLNPNSPSDASLRGNYVLSQDAYGSSKFLALPGGDFPIPGLAVGRLVETPAEIAGMLDAYEATHGVIAPRSSLVTGYDFLADAATEVASQLGAGTGSAVDTLITNSGVPPSTVGDPPIASWTADHLRAKLFGPRHDVVYLAGHFSANNALAADYTSTIVTTELAASTVDLRNSLIFSAGCHSGYNLVDADGIPGVTLNLDWAQAFAQKGATLIAGTGYQYGDTDFLEYSERLYTNFSRQLRTGTGNIPVGDALVRAKLDYLAATPDIRGIHEKALLEATLFGMPMLGVNMLPSARLLASTPPTGVALTPDSAGLATSTLSLQDGGNMTLNEHLTPLANLAGDPIPAKWFSGQKDSDVVTNPAQPILPLVTVDVTPAASTGLVLRGVGFVGGSYDDSPPMYPLTGAPTTESSNVHLAFEPPVFYPNLSGMWTPNYFGALSGTGGTSLHVTPVQHKGYDVLAGTSVQRKFSKLDLKLYYSNRTGVVATSAGATIGFVNATSDGAGGVVFTAQVLGDPAAGIQDVWVTYTKDDGVWKSVPLSNCVAPLPAACGTLVDSRMWAGSPLPPELVSRVRYVVQAATKTGLVSLDSNQGAYYLYGFAAPVATALQISAPEGAVFGTTIPVTVTLKNASGTPLEGKSVLVSIGGGGVVAVTQTGGTNAGTKTVDVPVIGVVPSTTKPAQVTASFYGEDGLLSSSATALLASSSSALVTVQRAPTTLTPVSIASPNVGATLKSGSQPLPQRSVRFTFHGNRGQPDQNVVAITNDTGTAIAGPPAGLIPDTYTVTAQFPATGTDSDPTYYPSTPLVLTSAGYVVPTYEQAITVPDGQLPTVPGCTGYCAPYNSTFTFAPTASSGGTVTVAAAEACSNVGTTVTMTSGTGSCNLTATQAGTPDYAQQTLRVSVAALKANQTITFAPFVNKTFGDAPFTIAATATSGLPVSFAVAGNCTVATTTNPVTNTITITDAGTCTIAADQGGNGNYSAAPQVTQSFTVARAKLIVSASASPSSYTYGDDSLPSTVSVMYASTFSGTLACLNSQTPATLTGQPAVPVSAGTYTITPTLGIGQLSSSCDLVANVATLTVSRAPSAFASIVASLIAPAGTTANITGLLNRPDKPTVYPKAADLVGNAFSVVLKNAGGTVKTYYPVPGDANGTFTITDSTLPSSSYTLEFKYVGAGNFLGATSITSALRVEGFTATGSMLQARRDHSATLLNDGRVLVVGGLDASGSPTATSELYCPAASTVCPAAAVGKFTGSGNLPSKSAGHTATLLLPSGKVVVIGGGNSSAQIFDPATKVWTAAGGLTARSYHTATLLGNGKVLIAGGVDNSSKTIQSTLIFDPATGGTTNGPTMLYARDRHTATLLTAGPNTGKVLLAGGRQKSGSGYVVLSSAELYDPVTNTVGSASAMAAGRFSHATAILTDGRVVVAGGSNATGATVTSSLARVEIYAGPATGTWAWAALDSSSDLWEASGRREFTLTRVGDGRLLAAGGVNATTARLASSELFSPNAFTIGAGMVAARSGHTATLLPDGRVLVVGGAGASGSSISGAELYNGPPGP